MRLHAFAPAAATTLAVLAITHAHGLGLTPDALSYLGAADALAHGAGLRVPISDWYEAQSSTPLRHFPPGLSALLSLPIALGVGAMDAARWLQALLAGAIVWLACALACSVSPKRAAQPAVLLCASFLLVTPAWNRGVLLVLSEPLFVALLVLAAWLMLRAPERVLGLGCVTACCALTRYAGIAAPLTAALFIATRPISVRQRARDVLLASSPPVVAIATWHHCAGRFRELGWFTTGWRESLGQALITACDWLAPWPLPIALRVSCVVLAIVGALVLLRNELQRERAREHEPAARLATLVRITAALWVSYAAVVVGSRLCADPDIPFDWRISSPLIVSTTPLMAAVMIRRWPAMSWASRAVLAGYLGLWFAGELVTSAAHVGEHLSRGAGYSSMAWQEGELARWLRGPGRSYRLYTDNPAIVWFIDQHPGRMLPNADEVERLPEFVRLLRSNKSVIIGFADPFDPTLDPAWLAREVGFVQLAQFEQASVWGANLDGCASRRSAAISGETRRTADCTP